MKLIRLTATILTLIVTASLLSSDSYASDTDKVQSTDGCSTFSNVPTIQSGDIKVPALLMKTSGTACAKLVFLVYKNFTQTSSPKIVDFSHSLSIWRDYHIGSYSTWSMDGRDYTNLFNITETPRTVDLSNYPIGSRFTVTYMITPRINATGFYDHTLPNRVNDFSETYCNDGYPLAVGYGADQVNASDFGFLFPYANPCASRSYGLIDIQISNMDYTTIDLKTQPPLWQFQSGIKATDIGCNKGLQLILASDGGYPACVTPTTANILEKWNWGYSP